MLNRNGIRLALQKRIIRTFALIYSNRKYTSAGIKRLGYNLSQPVHGYITWEDDNDFHHCSTVSFGI